MMNEKHAYLQALQVAFKPVFQAMTNRYLPYQLNIESGGAGNSLAKAIGRYVIAFSEEGITDAEITKCAMSIINDRAYATKPPLPREFALAIADQRGEGNDELGGALYSYFDRMQVRYKGLWHDVSRREDVVRSWNELAKRFSLTQNQMARVENILWSDSAFSKYPPSEKVIEQVMGIVAKGEVVTLPSKSYLAAAGKFDPCPLVRKARSRFGAFAIRTRTDLTVRREFEEFYGSLLDQYLNDEISLEEDTPVESDAEAKPDEPVLSKEEMMEFFKRS